MNTTIIPFVFEDRRLKINNYPVLVPSNNKLGTIEKDQAYTMLAGNFINKQDLIDTLLYIGLDIDPNCLDTKNKYYEIKYQDSIKITVTDMYQDCYNINKITIKDN